MKIKELRIARNMTQTELSDKLGISRQALANYEAGRREPDNETLIKIADILGTSIDNLLDRVPLTETDDFTYALYNEMRELSEEDKQQLINMARFLKSQKENR